jgi:hypothetical protein
MSGRRPAEVTDVIAGLQLVSGRFSQRYIGRGALVRVGGGSVDWQVRSVEIDTSSGEVTEVVVEKVSGKLRQAGELLNTRRLAELTVVTRTRTEVWS